MILNPSSEGVFRPDGWDNVEAPPPQQPLPVEPEKSPAATIADTPAQAEVPPVA